MDNDFGIGERAPWNNFPDIIRNSDLYALKNEPEYIAAKSGDLSSALILVERLISSDFIKQIKQMGIDKSTKIVPVRAVESSGKNKIPLALAYHISEVLNLEIDLDIVQIDKVFRTGTGSDHRLAFNPRFEGSVQKDQQYIIVDDNLTMGGTLASLRGYIHNRGGNVICGAVVCARANPSILSLPIKEKMYNDILNKHGQQINLFWQETFHYGIDKLTHSEAGHLRRATTFDEIRNRITSARDAGIRHSMQTTNRRDGNSTQTENGKPTVDLDLNSLIESFNKNPASQHLDNVSDSISIQNSLKSISKVNDHDNDEPTSSSPRMK